MKSSDASSEDWFGLDAEPVEKKAAPVPPEPTPRAKPAKARAPTPLPPPSENEPRALRVLTRALAQQRLPHGILFYGEAIDAVAEAAHSLAGRILETATPLRHADCFALRPSGKARFIRVDPMREFIRNLYLSPNQGLRKVGIIYDADRMMAPAANAFLKTLEEPPSDTTLFLLTSRPHDFLPTIHSRCFHFRIPGENRALETPQWAQWKADFAQWLAALERIASGQTKADPAASILPAYALAGKLNALIQQMADERWEQTKETLPDGVGEEEQEALEEGMRKGVRTHLLHGVEKTLRDAALLSDEYRAERAARLIDCVHELERARGLLEINLNESAAIEQVFLTALRTWTRPYA